MTSGPTRRAVLTSGLAGLLSACTTAPRRRTTPAAPDPDLALTAAAVARERVLLAAYDAVLATTPALAAQLGPLRADHLVHLAALGASPTPPLAAPGTHSLASSGAPVPGAPDPTAPSPGTPVPGAPRPHLPAARGAKGARTAAELPGLERRAAAAHAAAAVTCSRQLAPVLASLAASESSHEVVLR